LQPTIKDPVCGNTRLLIIQSFLGGDVVFNCSTATPGDFSLCLRNLSLIYHRDA
jgi:hypothetical protein